MIRRALLGRWKWLALPLMMFALCVACGVDEAAAPTTTMVKTVKPFALSEPSPTLAPSPSPTRAPIVAEPTTSPTDPPTPTITAEPPSWYGVGTTALVVVGDSAQADLYALSQDGETWVALPDVGSQVSVSPDGSKLGFVRWGQDGAATLELRDAGGGESRQITPDTTSGLLRFTFAPVGRRLAYLDLGAPNETGVPWALVVLDLEGDAVARYDALMTDDGTQPLPGAPIAWSRVASTGDELILDTFLPYSEGGWMGVWGVTLPPDGASAPFDTLPSRELLPGTPVYSSDLYFAPNGQSLAFLGRDVEYFPANYFPEFFDLAVNRLEVLTLDDGARTELVQVGDGSALGRTLAWSPAGDRLLFAQGYYDGESFATLTLKSSDLSGAVVEHGLLTLPPLGGLLELAWCETSLALYVTWDGGAGVQRLSRFDLDGGLSTEVLAAQRVEIVGCAP